MTDRPELSPANDNLTAKLRRALEAMAVLMQLAADDAAERARDKPES